MLLSDLDKMVRVATRKNLTEIVVQHGTIPGAPELQIVGLAPTGATFTIQCQKVNDAYSVTITKKPAPVTTSADEELAV